MSTKLIYLKIRRFILQLSLSFNAQFMLKCKSLLFSWTENGSLSETYADGAVVVILRSDHGRGI